MHVDGTDGVRMGVGRKFFPRGLEQSFQGGTKPFLGFNDQNKSILWILMVKIRFFASEEGKAAPSVDAHGPTCAFVASAR